MSWLAALQALPDLIGMFKQVMSWLTEGISLIEIKVALNKIDNAFKIKDPTARAKALNDIFRTP